MATIEFWIQLENHPWDVAPNNIDRISGLNIKDLTGGNPVSRTLTSPETGASRTATMYFPANEGMDPATKDWKAIDALILRRYTANWAAPDDRKVNPWDLNEGDPTDNGTMGTIPGPLIECKVGDKVIVHFRNKDFRASKGVHERTHSLHPHGFVFENRYDGAYPLSPPDPAQPVGAEAALWAAVGVSGNKKGDRVPPGTTFNYTWETFSWPTTAGVWLYHDHSICDMENVMLGAIGIIVIHNPNDPDDVLAQDLPGGSLNGSPVRLICFPFPFPVPALPLDVDRFLVAHPPRSLEVVAIGPGMHNPGGAQKRDKEPDVEAMAPDPKALKVHRGDLILELADDLVAIKRICLPFYRTPPQKGLYLQLYHEMPGVGMLINGRKYLGNAPTLVAGPDTKMRFGVVGMNMAMFHTFHLHGHRWVIPGPKGDHPGGGDGPDPIQNSPLIHGASQFEDTKIFGPANSFSFTINQGTFMGAPIGKAFGEWHMHCHVLSHMMSDTGGGMMGSLLIVKGGELALGLPRGEPCHMATIMPDKVVVKNFAFTPAMVAVPAGANVTFDFQEAGHTVRTVSTTPGTNPITATKDPGGDPGVFAQAVPAGETRTVTISGIPGGQINYECGIHGAGMSGTIMVI